MSTAKFRQTQFNALIVLTSQATKLSSCTDTDMIHLDTRTHIIWQFENERSHLREQTQTGSARIVCNGDSVEKSLCWTQGRVSRPNFQWRAEGSALGATARLHVRQILCRQPCAHPHYNKTSPKSEGRSRPATHEHPERMKNATLEPRLRIVVGRMMPQCVSWSHSQQRCIQKCKTV